MDLLDLGFMNVGHKRHGMPVPWSVWAMDQRTWDRLQGLAHPLRQGEESGGAAECPSSEGAACQARGGVLQVLHLT